LFSGLYSFADGLYSTLWTDGLASGAARLAARPPWNYDLMNAGCLLAVTLCLLLILGFLVALVWLVRRPTAEWFAVLGITAAFGLGLLYMSLRVPSYAQAKAFYAFPALLPFCAIIVVGWNWLGDRNRFLRLLLWFVLVVWAVTVYAAFWIRDGNPQIPLVRGLYLAEHQQDAGARESLSLALQRDAAARRSGKPGLLDASRAEAHFNLGSVLDRQGLPKEAVAQYLEALRVRKDFAGAMNNLAWLLATSPRDELRNGPEAVRLAERACTLTHDQMTVYIGTLGAAYVEAGLFHEAVAAARKACECARLRNEKELAAQNEQLLELYRAGKRYRE
jgi:tetratricopeptide (TPR) repeat protein